MFNNNIKVSIPEDQYPNVSVEEVKDVEALFNIKSLSEPFTCYNNYLVKLYVNNDNFRIEESDKDI